MQTIRIRELEGAVSERDNEIVLLNAALHVREERIAGLEGAAVRIPLSSIVHSTNLPAVMKEQSTKVASVDPRKTRCLSDVGALTKILGQ